MERAVAQRPTTGRLHVAVPPQHGAWAFLAVPLALGLILAGPSPAGLLFSAAWVLSYPASYYLGRSLAIRLRRGSWTRSAQRARRDAVPWAIGAGAAWAVLVQYPWLVLAAAALGAAWLAGVGLTSAGRERGLGNDLLLVMESAAAVPMLWAVTIDAAPPATAWAAAGICLVFFTGSVLHVKSLIRGAGNPQWARASRIYHIAALGMGLLSPWLLLPFAAAAVRAFAVPAGTRPPVVGAVETVVSVLVVVGGAAALA